MNQSQLLDKRVLIELLKNSPTGPVARTCYEFYRTPFLAFCKKHKIIRSRKSKELYQTTFSRLLVELTENNGNLLGTGTLFSGLTILAIIQLDVDRILRKNIGGFDAGMPFIDSNLIINLLKKEFRGVLDQLHYTYREHLGITFCTKHGIDITHRRQLDEILESDSRALVIFQQKVRDGQVNSPMTATVFTYLYRIFANVAKEDYRKRQKIQKFESSVDEVSMFMDISGDTNQYWEGIIERYSSLQRYDFKDQKELVIGLFRNLDHPCIELFTRHYLEEASLESIGLELGLKNPKRKIHDCRQKLRKKIKK